MTDNAWQLQATMAALQAQRALLGDAVVDEALKALREKLAALTQPEQQLKAVTVLFLDVVGSTRLAEQLDPEDIHAVMDGALERLSAIVVAHRGKVLQYAGDNLLAVFGADGAHEDDAERAVRAGLAMLDDGQAQAVQLREERGHAGFNVRVGISSGPVLLGGGVDGEGSIRGITVNIAARMEQSAPPGALRISHATWRHVRGLFEVKAEPPIDVKGISEPIRSYLVQCAKPRAFRLANRGIEGVETRMVGRAAEFARLTDAYETMLGDGRLTLVSLVGDAGLGKSRLLFEFDHWLELCPEALWFFHGRARPLGQNIPYGLLRDLFAWRFEILDSDSQATAQAKLSAGFGTLFGKRAEEQTALIGELIGLDYSHSPHIAGIAQDARQIRDRAFHAGALYFRALQQSTGAPVVLLLDDLHWADDGSLDFINHLLQSCDDMPMMVLCLTRPALYDRRSHWGSGQRHHERIDLAPLSRRSSCELADALLCRLDPVPAALRELLTRSAEGNPFFVEELLGMLIDDGVIITHSPGDPERWQVVDDKLPKVQVPPTLAGLLQARLDGLPPQERRALQQASVIGHVFWDEPLRRIDPDAPQALDALERRELAHGRETSAFEGVREYVFKHHLLHQVAYDSVLKRYKREQHRATAEWLVAKSGERASEYHGLVAEHFERAGETAQAALYLRKAGEDAAKAYANAAALDYLGRALALTPFGDAEQRFAVLLARVKVLSNTGQRDEQQDDIAALELLAETFDDDARRAGVAGHRAAHAVATGDYRAATAAAECAAAWAGSAGDPGAALSALVDAARALHFQGDARAQQHTEQVLALARKLGHRKMETVALNQMGIVVSDSGRYGEARDFYDQALQIARATNDRALEGAVLNNLGDCERYLGHYRSALQRLEDALRVFREIGQRMGESYALCNLAWVAQVGGDAALSLVHAEQAIALAQQVRDRDLEASILCTQGRALAAVGQPDAAAHAYQRSLEIFAEIGRPAMQTEPLAGLAALALAEGDTPQAQSHVTAIVTHFDGGGDSNGTEDPMWIGLTCFRVLAAAGAPRAAAFLARVHGQLMEHADSLSAVEREGFLLDVPTHRAIIDAWQAAQPQSAQ